MREQQKQQGALGRTETLTTVLSPTAAGPGSSQAYISLNSSTSKRPSSPERRREDSKTGGERGGYGPPHKRVRDLSPPAGRWASPAGKDRRYGSPAWDRERERERERSPPPRRGGRGGGGDREDEKPIVPQVLSWFMGQLPQSTSFDGPSSISLRRTLSNKPA